MLLRGGSRSPFPALALAALAAACLAVPARAAVTVGEIQTDPEVCVGTLVINQIESTPLVPYAMPSAGVLTSWSHLAITAGGQEMSLLVFRTVGPSTYRLIGKSTRENIQSAQLNTFATRVPVSAGDTLGLRVPTPAGCVAFSDPGHQYAGAGIHEPVVGTDSFLETNFGGPARINVSARLEPDVDADGFGDETQDTGPTIALTKVPKKKSEATKATVRFGADQEGVAFSCSLDDKAPSPCTSPLKIKKLKPGKHSLSVQGTDVAGFTGPAATTRWKVRPPK